MSSFILVCLLALLPVCTSINCYECVSCNDPFSSSGVSIDGSWTYCMKTGVDGTIARSGTFVCVNTPWISGTGISCCTTDLCNGARIICQTPILLAVALAVIFAKFQWA